MPRPPSTPEVFWAKSKPQPNTGCRVWQGRMSRRKGGPYRYALLQYRGRSWTGHRLAWVLTHGPLGPEHHVQQCPLNRRCVAPAHLTLSRAGPGLVHAQGEGNTHARLTEAQVRDFRRRKAEGATLRELAAEAGCSLGTVSAAVTGRTWRHVA